MPRRRNVFIFVVDRRTRQRDTRRQQKKLEATADEKKVEQIHSEVNFQSKEIGTKDTSVGFSRQKIQTWSFFKNHVERKD